MPKRPRTKHAEAICYLITNEANAKRYVGVTQKSLATRWREHLSDAQHGSSFMLHCAIRKHGEDAFTIRTLASASTWSEAAALERKFITELGTHIADGRGYNMTTGGDGAPGHKHTAETLALLRKAKSSPEHIKALKERTAARRAANRPALEARRAAEKEAKAQARAIRLELAARRAADRETRRAAREASGKKRLYTHRRTFSAAACAAVSARMKGRRPPEACFEAQRLAMRTYKHSAETRARMSAGQKGKTWSDAERAARIDSGSTRRSPECRAKIAAKAKARWRNPGAREKARQAVLNRLKPTTRHADDESAGPVGTSPATGG